MQLEIMLFCTSQAQKDKYHVFPNRDSTSNNSQNDKKKTKYDMQIERE